MFTLLNTIKKEKEGESQRGREREEINRFSFSGVQIPNRSTGKTLPDTGTHQAKVHCMFYWQKIMTSAKRMSLMQEDRGTKQNKLSLHLGARTCP